MKKTGLRNRFTTKTRSVWDGHYSCLVCGMNQWDTLHHIVSPNTSVYVDGPHNKSVLNSCPIHNFAHPNKVMNLRSDEKYCHFGREGTLTNKEVVAFLLQSVYKALISHGYLINEDDEAFMYKYSELYLMDVSDPFLPVEKSGDKVGMN